MDLLIERLEGFGLENFIKVHRLDLCNRTLNQNKIAAVLQFDFDQVAIIKAFPDNFSRNEKLYELIQQTKNVRKFLEALDETGNEHILKLIKEANLSSGGTVTATSAGGNPSGSASSSSASSSTVSRSLERKAELVTQHLATVKLADFLRPNLLDLCKNTKDLKAFILSLHQLGVISSIEKDECSRMDRFDACDKLYEIAGQEGDGTKLIQALQSSENGHILEKMYQWVKN